MNNIPNPLNLIYESEPSRMLIVLNALSLLTSHLGQINGLKKSNRENKEFLIKQENNELILDLVLTLGPPSFIKSCISKLLEAKNQSGKLSLNKNQIDGINTVVTIVYSVLASNVIMPILKNKLTNKQYQNERKSFDKLSENINNNIEEETSRNTLNVFSNADNSITTTKVVDETVYNNLLNKEIDNKNIFNEVRALTQISSQSTGLRI